MKETNCLIALTETQKNSFRREGYIVMDVLFSEEELQEIRGEFNRVWQDAIQAAEKRDAKSARMTKNRPFLVNMHQASATCASFLKHPALLDICRQMIGPDVESIYNQAVIKPPTQEKNNAFAWHQDAYYGIHGSSSHLLDHAVFLDSTKAFVCWVAVTRTTVANGTLWVVPGMHRHGLLPHTLSDETGEWICQFDSSAAIPVELRAGQMLIFSMLLPHRSGPNVSDETRMAYQFSYTVPGGSKLPSAVFPVLRHGEECK